MKKLYTISILFLLSLQMLHGQARRYRLFEHFTNDGCGPCAEHNPEFYGILAPYKGAFHCVSVHPWWPDSRDPMFLHSEPFSRKLVAYYGISGVPHTVFDGNATGGSLPPDTNEVSPISLNVVERLDAAGTGRDVTIDLRSWGLLTPSTYVLKVAVIEDFLEFASQPGWNGETYFPYVLRTMASKANGDTISIPAIGSSYTYTYHFPNHSAWNTDNIYTVAWIQNTATKEIINSGSSADHGVQILNPAAVQIADKFQSKVFTGSVSTLSFYKNTRCFLQTENMPAGWKASLILNGQTFLPGDTAEGAAKIHEPMPFSITVTPNENHGIGVVKLMAYSPNNVLLPVEVSRFYLLSGVTDVVIDAEGGAGNYVSVISPQTSHAAKADTGLLANLANSPQVMQYLKNIYYAVGRDNPGISSNIAAGLKTFMDLGGNLMISGENIGRNIYTGTPIPSLTSFYENYLDASYQNDGNNLSNVLVNSTSTDSLFQSMGSSLFRSDAMGNATCDELNGQTTASAAFYNTSSSRVVGLRFKHPISKSKVVYLGFSPDLLQDSLYRNQLIDLSFDWFHTGQTLPVTLTADFDKSINGYDASFTNLSASGNVLSWNFGDGNSSTLNNPQHVYAISGDYMAKLKISDYYHCDSVEKSVKIIKPIPIADFLYTLNGYTMNCTNTSSKEPEQYSWNFGDGSTSNLSNPSHTYASSGSYVVTLICTNSSGADTILKTVQVETVIVKPVADFSYTTQNYTLNFSNTSLNNPNSIQWNFGDGEQSTATNPTHTYATFGSYLVKLIVSNASGADTVAKEIKLNKIVIAPSAAFSFTAIAKEVHFSDESSDEPTSFSWSFGDGAISSTQHPIHTYGAAGTYSISLTVSNSAGSTTTTRSITVTDAVQVPIAQFGYATQTLQVSFSNQSKNFPTAYAWDFGDGTSSSLKEPVHEYSAEGSYIVSLTVSNSAGSHTSNQQITVKDAVESPIAAFSYTTASKQVTFTNTSLHLPTHHYWRFGDGTTSSLKHPIHTYAADGTYPVTLIVSNSKGIDSIVKPVEVKTKVNPPVANFSYTVSNLTATFKDQSQNTQPGRTWNFGDGSTSTVTSPVHTYLNPGTYTVSLTAHNSNGTDTKTREITVSKPTTSLNTATQERFKLYPNPANTDVWVELPQKDDCTITLINNIGVIVRKQRVRHTDRLELQISDLPAGIYILKVSSDRFNKQTMLEILH